MDRRAGINSSNSRPRAVPELSPRRRGQSHKPRLPEVHDFRWLETTENETDTAKEALNVTRKQGEPR